MKNHRKNSKLSGKYQGRFNQATRWHQQNQLEKAEELYEKILRKHPKHADSLHLLGLIKAEHEDLAAGLRLVSQAITVRPNYAFFYLNRSMMYQRLGDLAAAISDTQKSIQLDSKQWNSYAKLGELYQKQEQHEIAIKNFLSAIELNATDRNSYHNLGKSYLALEKYNDAVSACQKALEIDPNCVATLVNLGVVLYNLKQAEQAIKYYQRAIELSPNYAEAYINLGMALLTLNNLVEAEQKIKHAIKLAPQEAEFHSCFGNLRKEQGDLTAALECFNHALDLDPDSAAIRFNLAITQLQLGDFEQGLVNYEVRFKLTERQCVEYHFSQPIWKGESLIGKTLFITVEQGLGDTIQFIRYLPMLEKYGGNIILECQKELISLVKGQFKNITVIPRWNPPNYFDYHIAIMSLALIFKTTINAIPSSAGYLSVSDKPEFTKLIKPKSLNVGVVWAGGDLHKNNANRSIALTKLKPLLDCKKINFYSLQIGRHKTDIETYGFTEQLIDMEPHIKDFTDTAAILAKLNVLITVDTAIAHLGGALGIPTWILLPFAADFRWLQGCNDSRWYDSVRLFRQCTPRDWGAPIAKIKQALEQEFN